MKGAKVLIFLICSTCGGLKVYIGSRLQGSGSEGFPSVSCLFLNPGREIQNQTRTGLLLNKFVRAAAWQFMVGISSCVRTALK